VNAKLSETTGTEKVLNFLKLAAALGCVALFCNGMLARAKAVAPLAVELKTTLVACAQHTSDANAAIDFAANPRSR